MQPLRFGIVGLGVMGAHHARVLGQIEGLDLVGVVDPIRAGDRVAGYEIASSVSTLLDDGIDCCVVAAPTSAHAAIGMELAESRVHALIEKPLAMTVSEAIQLRDAFVSAKLVGAVGHVERYNASLQEMKRRIAAGQIGRILQLRLVDRGPSLTGLVMSELSRISQRTTLISPRGSRDAFSHGWLPKRLTKRGVPTKTWLPSRGVFLMGLSPLIW